MADIAAPPGGIGVDPGGGQSDLPFFSITDPAEDAALTAAIIDTYSGIVLTFTTTSPNDQEISPPATSEVGKSFSVLNDFTSIGVVSITQIGHPLDLIAPGDMITYVWDGTAWYSEKGPLR